MPIDKPGSSQPMLTSELMQLAQERDAPGVRNPPPHPNLPATLRRGLTSLMFQRKSTTAWSAPPCARHGTVREDDGGRDPRVCRPPLAPMSRGLQEPENRGLGHSLSVAPHMMASQRRRDHGTISTGACDVIWIAGWTCRSSSDCRGQR